MKDNKGFTLVELLISLTLGLVILGALYAMVNMGQKSTLNIERKVAASQDAREALEMMSLEIQMASYNPRPDLVTTTFWMAPTTCTAATAANQTHLGIQQATPNAITVEMNLSGNGSIGDNPNEVITYNYDAANQYISRSLDCGSGLSAFLGDLPANPRAVRVINTAAIPVFRYFNAQGTEIASASMPASIPDIARIDITLWVETQDIDMNSKQRKRIFYTTSVIPRNHVIGQ